MGSPSERARIDQIVAEFFAKSLHVILESRVLHVCALRSPSDSPAVLAKSSHRAPNRWFNLELDQSDAVQEHVELWRRSTLEPMVVDIVLQQPMPGGHGWHEGLPSPTGQLTPPDLVGHMPSSGSPYEMEGADAKHVGPQTSETLLERWVVQYERRRNSSSNNLVGMAGAREPPVQASNVAVEVPVVYKRTVILLRSLYAMARLLPAHRLFRLAKSNPNQRHAFALSYRVSPAPLPLSDADAAAMSTWHLTPVDTPTGRMSLSVAYRHTTAVTAQEVGPPLLPRIIADYVGSPTTDPLRRFPAHQGAPPRKGVHIVPLPVTSPSSAPTPSRRHSWSTSPVHYRNYPPPSPKSQQPHKSSSLSTRTMSMPPNSSSPIQIQGNTQHRSYSPSPSPSPPTPSAAPQEACLNPPMSAVPRSVSAPMSIPRPGPHTQRTSPVLFARPGGELSSGSPLKSLQQPPKSAAPRTTRSRSFSSSDSPAPSSLGGNALLIPRPSSSSSSPPQWQPSSVPENWSIRPPTPSGASASGSELSGIAFSPPLPFACTPRVSPAVSLGGTSSSAGSGSAKVPPISGKETSALILARYPSFSLTADPKAAAGLSISPLVESSLQMSPPHAYHQVRKGLQGDLGGVAPTGLRWSLYGQARPPLTSPNALSLEDDGDDEVDLPFIVDDVEDEVTKDRRPGDGNWPSFESKGTGLQGAATRGTDAAVGALVRILKSAPPLRAHPLESTPGGSAPEPPAGSSKGPGSGRKVSEALEELRGYSEMKEGLMRQRGDGARPSSSLGMGLSQLMKGEGIMDFKSSFGGGYFGAREASRERAVLFGR